VENSLCKNGNPNQTLFSPLVIFNTSINLFDLCRYGAAGGWVF